MRQAFFSLSLLLVFVPLFRLQAQENGAEKYYNEGIRLYDMGDYSGALKQYQQAIQLEPKSTTIHYEMGSTYFALKNYEQALAQCDFVLKEGGGDLEAVYILKGSVLDMQGKPKEAIQTYRQGCKQFPESHLLYYNLALTLYNNQGDADDVEKNLQKSMLAKPTHASSYLLMGYLMNDQHKRIKSLLAFCRFLILEPNGSRSAKVYTLVNKLLKQGVTRSGEKATTINISLNKEDGDDFAAAEMMLSLLEASKSLEENQGKSEIELFVKNSESLFSMLSELRKKQKDFWWTHFVDYFKDMQDNHHVEAFCYFISQSAKSPDINTWLSNHKTQLDALRNWHAARNTK